MLLLIGLVVITVAWLQVISPHKKAVLNPLFLIFYVLGSITLAYDSFLAGMISAATLNLVIGGLALAVLISHKY